MLTDQIVSKTDSRRRYIVSFAGKSLSGYVSGDGDHIVVKAYRNTPRTKCKKVLASDVSSVTKSVGGEVVWRI